MVSNIGNVGVGIVAPTEKLHVVGNILATGTVSGTNVQEIIPGLIHHSLYGMTNTSGASFDTNLELRGTTMMIRFKFSSSVAPHTIIMEQNSTHFVFKSNFRQHNHTGVVLYIGMNSQDLTVSGSVYANSDLSLIHI